LDFLPHITNIFIFTRKKMLKELNRKMKKSKGRQKVPIPIDKVKPSFGTVASVKEIVKKQKRKDERKLGYY
jgi:hypothetical protein